jgi:hypothetical protein
MKIGQLLFKVLICVTESGIERQNQLAENVTKKGRPRVATSDLGNRLIVWTVRP